MYTRDLWDQANQTQTRFYRLDSRTINSSGSRFIVARYYSEGTMETSLSIPLNHDGRPMPPYDFPVEGDAGFKLAGQLGSKWADSRSTRGAPQDTVSQAGIPVVYQWYAILGDNKVAAAYRLKDGDNIEPVLGSEQNLWDIVGSRSDCIFVVLPLNRPRSPGERLAAHATALIVTPFTVVADTVELPMELFLIGLASGMS
jgi:hypothetical protein